MGKLGRLLFIRWKLTFLWCNLSYRDRTGFRHRDRDCGPGYFNGRRQQTRGVLSVDKFKAITLLQVFLGKAVQAAGSTLFIFGVYP
jgi:hypothetical protein